MVCHEVESWEIKKRRDITGSSESDDTKVSRIFVGYEKGAFLALSGEK